MATTKSYRNIGNRNGNTEQCEILYIQNKQLLPTLEENSKHLRNKDFNLNHILFFINTKKWNWDFTRTNTQKAELKLCVCDCPPGTGWSSPVTDRDTFCLYLSGRSNTYEAGTPGHLHPTMQPACPLCEWPEELRQTCSSWIHRNKRCTYVQINRNIFTVTNITLSTLNTPVVWPQ